MTVGNGDQSLTPPMDQNKYLSPKHYDGVLIMLLTTITDKSFLKIDF